MLNRARTPLSPPIILIAESNPLLLNRLPSVIRYVMPHVHLDLCSSVSDVFEKLRSSRPHLFISGTRLAERDDFMLIRRSKLLQPSVPLVVTSEQAQRESLYELLQGGAFDFIDSPIDPVQLNFTLRMGIWYHRIQGLIAMQQLALSRYEEHRALFPVRDTLKAMDNALLSIPRTIECMQRSIAYFKRVATEVQSRARQQALDRIAAPVKERTNRAEKSAIDPPHRSSPLYQIPGHLPFDGQA